MRPVQPHGIGIAQQLSLLLVGAVLLAVLTVGGLSAWTLRSGFSDYLRLRDDEQMTRLVELVQARATQHQGMDWLSSDHQAMRLLMDELHGQPLRSEAGPEDEHLGPARHPDGGARPPPPPSHRQPVLPVDEVDGLVRPLPPGTERNRPLPRPGEPAEDPRSEDAQRPPHRSPPPRPGPPRSDTPGSLFERVVITDAQGRWLAGRQPPGAAISTRQVQVNGVTVAQLALVPSTQPAGLDALFLQRQYTGLLAGALFTALVAGWVAWWVARRWSRPLLALSQASRQIASGEWPQALVPAGAHEMAQLAVDMNHMAQSLARLEQARRLWIAQISHELRTPLAVLRGELEAIEDGARQPTPEVLNNLHEEVMQLNRLVDDLHTLSVADLGAPAFDFQTGDADAALRRVLVRFEPQALQRRLVLKCSVQAFPVTACWDFQRIEQVLTNLLSNSLRHTDAPGEVRVDWQIHPARQVLTLTVEDSAPGVSPADLVDLFEPLFRADKARQRGPEHGSGLGLAIVRSLVRGHHGQVGAAPSTLGGLRVTVELPLQAPDTPASAPVPT
jgi:two-component system sensor histidine kinase BaeS